LSERRALLQQASFKRIEEETINLEQLQEIPKSLAHTNKLPYEKLKRMNETCRELSQQSYPASAVFVTFQTEECQRRVLKALSVGSIYVATNDSSHIEYPKHVFRGKVV
jgi:Zn-dependent M16 (insulinase) family peptidase